MSRNHAGSSGGAPAPTPQVGGPVPLDPAALPDDLAALLPDGFVLPDNVQLVVIPPVTPEAHAAGLREHAGMQAGILAGARTMLKLTKEHAAQQVTAMELAVENAQRQLDEAHANAVEAELAAGLDPGSSPEPGSDDGGGAA